MPSNSDRGRDRRRSGGLVSTVRSSVAQLPAKTIVPSTMATAMEKMRANMVANIAPRLRQKWAGRST